MDKISVTLPSETVVRLSNVVDESYDNRSEAVRDLVQKGFEYDELELENRRLQRQLAATNRRVDEHKQLQEYVEGQQELERRRARMSRTLRTVRTICRAGITCWYLRTRSLRTLLVAVYTTLSARLDHRS